MPSGSAAGVHEADEPLETVPEDGRRSEPFQKAMNIMGHIIAARRMWLYRFGASDERPANLFPGPNGNWYSYESTKLWG